MNGPARCRHELLLVRFDTALARELVYNARFQVKLYLPLAERGSVPVPATKEDQE